MREGHGRQSRIVKSHRPCLASMDSLSSFWRRFPFCWVINPTVSRPISPTSISRWRFETGRSCCGWRLRRWSLRHFFTGQETNPLPMWRWWILAITQYEENIRVIGCWWQVDRMGRMKVALRWWHGFGDLRLSCDCGFSNGTICCGYGRVADCDLHIWFFLKVDCLTALIGASLQGSLTLAIYE